MIAIQRTEICDDVNAKFPEDVKASPTLASRIFIEIIADGKDRERIINAISEFRVDELLGGRE